MTLISLSFDEARQVNEHLRFLLAGRTHAQRFVGRWLNRFLALDGLVALCYSSLRDYVREKLGLSLRECQELMSIEQRIAVFPETERLWNKGELNRCHVREIVGRVPPEDDFTWARLATRLTVRQLQEQLSHSGHPEPVREKDPSEGRLIEIAASPEFRTAFQLASTIVDRTYGYETGPMGCLQTCAMEWHASVSPEVFDRAEKMGKPPSRQWLAQGLKELEERRNQREQACELASVCWADLPRGLPTVVVPEWAIPENPTAFDIDDALRETVVFAQSVEGNFMRALTRALEAGVPGALGFDSSEHYARECLGMSATRLWSTLRLAHSLQHAPRIEEAYHLGEVSRSKAEEILKVATPPTDEAWIQYARSTTVRKLRDLVKTSQALRREEPSRYRDILPSDARPFEDPGAVGMVEELLRLVREVESRRAAAQAAEAGAPAAASAGPEPVADDKPIEEPLEQVAAVATEAVADDKPIEEPLGQVAAVATEPVADDKPIEEPLGQVAAVASEQPELTPAATVPPPVSGEGELPTCAPTLSLAGTPTLAGPAQQDIMMGPQGVMPELPTCASTLGLAAAPDPACPPPHTIMPGRHIHAGELPTCAPTLGLAAAPGPACLPPHAIVTGLQTHAGELPTCAPAPGPSPASALALHPPAAQTLASLAAQTLGAACATDAGELPTCAFRADGVPQGVGGSGPGPASQAPDDIPRVPHVGDVPISQRTTRMRFRIPAELDEFMDLSFALCSAWAERPMSMRECIELMVYNFVLQYAEEAAQEAKDHPVCERDGWRCTAPGCTRMVILHEHHLKFRSQGGSNKLWNLTTLCRFHHLKCLHEGRMRAVGSAPGNIAWALGLRPDGTPTQLFADEAVVHAR